jgi:hypothetical protein
LISPLPGTVEATLLTVVRFVRKGAELAVVVAAFAAADVLGELLVLLELPQPARTSATPTRARIDVLGTVVSPVVRVSDAAAFLLAAPPRPDLTIPSSALRQRSTHGPPFARFLYDSALAGFLPGEPLHCGREPFAGVEGTS